MVILMWKVSEVSKIVFLEEKNCCFLSCLSHSLPLYIDSVDDKEKHLEVLTSRWNIERVENRYFIDKGVLVWDSRARHLETSLC